MFIGIVQELRVKRTLDKVTLLSGSTACVVRGGRTRTVPTDELVLDDIVLRARAARLCADAVVADRDAGGKRSAADRRGRACAKTPRGHAALGQFCGDRRVRGTAG